MINDNERMDIIRTENIYLYLVEREKPRQMIQMIKRCREISRDSGFRDDLRHTKFTLDMMLGKQVASPYADRQREMGWHNE